jgi:hypothetical protein
MKKTFEFFIAVLFITVVFNSCKKSSDNSPSSPSMKFTSNGTVVSFNSCVEVVATVGSQSQILITGIDVTNGKAGTTSFEVQLIHDDATLKAGQVFQAATTFGQENSSALLYFTNDTDLFATQPGKPQGSVTLTEVTSTTIKGTFSGELFAEDDFTGDHVLYTITNGSFTALRGK